MKKKYLFIIILITLKCNSQNFKAVVVYSVKNVIADSARIQNLKNEKNFLLFEKMKSISEEFKLELKIKNGYSFFSNNSKPIQLDSNDGFLYSFAETAYRVNDNFYYNKENNEMIIEGEKFGEKLLISSNPNQSEWTLINKTKIIGEYLCYQAKRSIEFTSLNGIKRKKEQVVWYTMEIPISFGPKNFVGFPGLVLQVIDGKNQLTVSKIKLNPKKMIKIEEPSVGKRMTINEYEEFERKGISNTKSIFKN